MITPEKAKELFTQLNREYELNKDDIGPLWEKAQKAIRISAEKEKFKIDLRDALIAITEKIPLKKARKIRFDDMWKKDDYTTPTGFLIGNVENLPRSRAKRLKQKRRCLSGGYQENN